ncbi:P-loop containing nucleoside triphosphate hydrolase protein [Apiosordaria backusii]|uniref:RNA helicase n=1 Tax=Apiosordaria backusii TaxID=314023 RepID=A0AA40E631_9PEZI|nr:P-loop containing nucleoside triphosphate hydrolase protein [Apiosordaria backusii]
MSDWGNEDKATSNEVVDSFDIGDLAAAVPEVNGEAKPNAAKPAYPEASDNWIQRVPYNYNEFGDEGKHDWEHNAAVYEFDGEIGDVGPEHPALEVQLFGEPETRKKQGVDFSNITELEVFQEGPARVDPIANFEDAGLHPAMLNNVKLAGYETPTPIQRYCLPAIKMCYDVVAVAQTGSGKTAAYLIPILNALMGKAKKLAAPRPNPAAFREGIDQAVRAEPLVVIVCPSRELAVQVFSEARKFCYRTMLRPCVIYGGGPVMEQRAQLQKGCDVLIASPGRLIDFMNNPHVLSLRRVRYMVVDEADEMLHDDWKQDWDTIMSGGEIEEGNVRYMLFSATFPKNCRDLAKNHLAETHVRLRVGRAGSTHRNIKQVVYETAPYNKKAALIDLLESLPPTRTIIFVNAKRTADELDDFLYNLKFPCTSMHSDRTQKEREAALRGFRSGLSPILITTGLSARGIDVRNVMHVINYDLPSMDHGGIEEYTHRIGRTGRIGHRGMASSFFTERDEPIASVLTRTLLETGQEVPEFLSAYIPEDVSRLRFEADSDFDETETAADNFGGDDAADGGDADTWGAGDAAEAQPAVEEDSGW